MAFDPEANKQIDAFVTKYDLFVTNNTDKSKLPHLKTNLLRKLADFRKEYLDANWREPFLKAFKHPDDCNIVNYPSWNWPAYKGESEQDIYVYAAFVPPGKHTFMVKDCVLEEWDQIYFLKTVIGLKKNSHVPRLFKDSWLPMKHLETMPRNTRKFTKTKVMKLFQLDEHRENMFPDLQTPMQKKECQMDEYTLSIANKWLKEKDKTWVNACDCGSEECKMIHAFNIELKTLRDVWGKLVNIESVRANNSSFPYMSETDFRRLIKDMGLNLKETDIKELIETGRQEEEGVAMMFELMLKLANKLFQRVDKPCKPDELLQKLIKFYLHPMQQQYNWMLYRDNVKVWLPQKSLIIENNLK